MLISGLEYVCRTRDMSPGGLALIAPALGKVGERVIAYVEHFGRLEGRIVRSFSIGFAINLAATEHKRAKIATELAKLVDQQNLPEVIDS